MLCDTIVRMKWALGRKWNAWNDEEKDEKSKRKKYEQKRKYKSHKILLHRVCHVRVYVCMNMCMCTYSIANGTNTHEHNKHTDTHQTRTTYHICMLFSCPFQSPLIFARVTVLSIRFLTQLVILTLTHTCRHSLPLSIWARHTYITIARTHAHSHRHRSAFHWLHIYVYTSAWNTTKIASIVWSAQLM